MTLRSALSAVVDDLVALAAPLVARTGRRARIIAVAEGDALAIYQEAKGRVRRLDKAARRSAGGPVELRLPADMVIERTLDLPAASRDFLDPILDHRLERLTPWSPERAIYGYRVEGDAENGDLRVAFAATARDIADAWTGRAEALGLRPTALGSAAEPLDQPLALDLWRGARDVERHRARRLVKIAAAVTAAIVVPLLAGSIYAASSAEARLQSIEARAATARRTLQAAIGGAGSREATLIAAKRADGAMVVLIDRLAKALPHDTALRDLEIDPERIRLTGSSETASALIGRLLATGLVNDARFAAPVTRNPDGRDAFEILAARLGAQPAAAEASVAQRPGL